MSPELVIVLPTELRIVPVEITKLMFNWPVGSMIMLPLLMIVPPETNNAEEELIVSVMPVSIVKISPGSTDGLPLKVQVLGDVLHTARDIVSQEV